MLDLTSNLRLKFGSNFYPRATAVFQEMDTIGLSIPKGSQFFIRVRDKPLSVAVSASNPDSSHAGEKC